MGLRRFLALLAVALIAVVLITLWFFPPNEDFRVENPFWNGSREISSLYPVTPLEALSDLPPEPQGATLILVPYLAFTPAELGQLNDFVTNGGRLVLADDYGHGNQVLEYLGLGARFSGRMLLDPIARYKNQNLPRIVHFEPDDLTSNIQSLVFNHATCLTDVATASTLALSSSFSFLDLNGDGVRGEDEPTGPLPVISRQSLVRGEVILIADPSLFINSMEALDDNARLISNIAAATTLFMDQSHLPQSDLHQTKNTLVEIRGYLATPWGTSGLVILALIITLQPLWHRKKETPAGAPPPDKPPLT